MRESIERRAYWIGLAFCALCVVYFYLLDHFLFSSVHFSPIFRFLLSSYDRSAAWLALAICVFAPFWKRTAPVLQVVVALARNPKLAALATVGLTAIGAIAVYHRYPLSMDEYAAIFQSKTFASGNIAAQLPRNLIDWLVVRGFNGTFITASHETGRTIEAYWPGFAMLLTPFQFFNIGWLCNAILTGLALYLIFWITREVTLDEHAGGWAMLFALASSAFIANGISFYSMQAHMTANLLFAALLMKPSPFRAFGAGLVGSIALLLHNPFPHTLFAIPWIVALAMQRQLRNVIPLFVGYLPGLIFGYLWLTLRTEIGAGSGNELTALSGMAIGAFEWPNSVVFNMRSAASIKLLVWAMPCLFVFASLGCARWLADWRVKLMAMSAALTLAGFLFVGFDQGHGWGYRYFHSAWGTIPILAGCAMSYKGNVPPRMVSFAGAAAGLSLLLLVPLQLTQIEGFIAQHLAQLGAPIRPGNNIYFIRPLDGYYVADMIQSDPLLRDPDLLLVSHGKALDEQLIRLNWPMATKVRGGDAVDQWYLGPEEHRTSTRDGKGMHFVIAQLPP